MAEKGHSILSSRTLCFGLGSFGMILLALFMFYPALLSLFFGGGAASSITETGWSLPLLLLSIMAGGWFLIGMLALLRPELITQILPRFLTKGLEGGTGSSQQFKHGRAFALGSLTGQALIWPATIFAGLLILPFVFGHSGWFSILGGIFGGLFFLALFLRLLAPGLLSNFERGPAGTMLPPAWPFVSGIMVSGIIAALLAILGVLPPFGIGTQSVDKRQIDEGQTTNRANDNIRYYINWKGGKSVEVETTFCANGMSVFLPKDKGFIGKSTDPDSVVYDPYANDGDAIGIAGSASSTRDSATTNDKHIHPDWVRDLGAPRGLGTTHMRGNEKVGGYDFIEQSHIFAAKAFLTSPSQTEIETVALLVPTGCTDDDLAGITMRRQLLSQLDMGAHLVDNWDFTVNDTANFNLITDIPILDLDYSPTLLGDLDTLVAAHGLKKDVDQPPIIMVARWTREQETENRKIEEEKIRKALAARQRSNVVWISAGQLSPICNTPNPYCTALNSSTTIYVVK